VGIEALSTRPDAPAFDALWTVEPLPVREVARAALETAEGVGAGAPELHVALQGPPVAKYDVLRAATSLTNRVVAYLDRDGS
jgi:hypothetical protein